MTGSPFSTYVRTTCHDAPVRLAYPDAQSETVGVVCSVCRREAGRPGAEDAPEIAQFLRCTAPWPGLSAWVRAVNPS